MRFSIITPTYRRADRLIRAVNSVLAQTYTDWELIIVNDSPDDTSYQTFASSINDSRIHYHVNDMNRGVNYSRNRALHSVSSDSKWVIFLDDDDYFSPDTLHTLSQLIKKHGDKKWFVTNRAYTNGTPITKARTSDTWYSYAWEYLILKLIRGDATHCISTTSLHTIRFSEKIKQGEEWFFFYQLGLKETLFYHDHNSTISDGYDASSGLNFRRRSFTKQIETVSILFYEGVHRGLAYHPTFLIYVCMRFIRALVKHS
jgi:glycosyltransferase involved in cell wall biosynthesis